MKEQILQLRQEGKTYTEIQKILNCSKGTISYHCGDGQKEKFRKYNQTKKEKNKIWLQTIKDNLCCAKCGDSRNYVLDFHHINPLEKDMSVSLLLSKGSRKRVIDEIEKCIVLCSNCHRELHYLEKL